MIENMLKRCGAKEFSEDDVYDAYKIFFGTLVSEPRLKILHLLQNGRKNVSQVMESLNRDQTAVSHDLARLKKCGFVQATVEGPYRYYALSESAIKLLELIEKHMTQYCVHILNATVRK